MKSQTQKGFTLIELLVVIAIIGILASVTLASLNSARAKARDADRINDLRQAGLALQMWAIDNGSIRESLIANQCGWTSADGQGWFARVSSLEPTFTSVSECLYNAGYLSEILTDPTGAESGSTPTNTVHAYMYSSCSLGTYMYAKLETEEQTATATDGTCVATWDTSYGMNYWIKVD